MRKYTAYTLLEMLIVLGIFVILISLGMAAFSGLRDTISLNQDILNMQQDYRITKRQSMLLEKSATERWVYGLGLDFTSVITQRKYRIFKWCAQFKDYGDPKTTSLFPNYDSTLTLSQLNGNLPVDTTYVNTTCSNTTLLNEIIRLQGADFNGQISTNFAVNVPTSNDAVGDIGGVPVYVLFESVSGKTFFYDVNGRIVNYDSNGNMVSNPVDFKIEIASLKTKVMKTITISNISGKISEESEDL